MILRFLLIVMVVEVVTIITSKNLRIVIDVTIPKTEIPVVDGIFGIMGISGSGGRGI